jgi:hypothetical protein
MATGHPSEDPSRDRSALLRQLVELLTQTTPTGPTAVGVALLDGELELAITPLDDGDIVRALSGFRAPPAWDAFAVVAPATAMPVEGGPSRPVVLGVLAARDGTCASALVDPVEHGGDIDVRTDGDGRALDACRRVLGLATPPPVHRSICWAVTHWVDAVLAAVLDADLGETPPWHELRRLESRAAYAAASWAGIRAECIAGRVIIPSLPADTAAWMDVGMFARDALTAYPPIATMAADLRVLLPFATYEDVLREVCERLEPGSTADIRSVG